MLGTDRNVKMTLEKMKSFGGTAFRTKMAEKNKESKSWSSEVELLKRIEADRGVRVKKLAGIIGDCDDALDYGFGDGAESKEGGAFFDYTAREQMLEIKFDELMRAAAKTAEEM